MLKLTPVHKIEDLKKDDLVTLSDALGTSVVRVDCIDGDRLFLVAPHENIHFSGSKGNYHEYTFEGITRIYQILRIHSEEINS